MVDTMVLEAIVERRGSSSLPWGTILKYIQIRPLVGEIATSVEGLFKCTLIWGCSSVGRAVALQAIGRRFDPCLLHQNIEISCNMSK